MSTNKTGVPFLTAPFTSGTKLDALGFVKTLLEVEYVRFNHLKACYCGSIISGQR
jgi:hypothetical protein